MIISDFDLIGIALLPREADAPLLIDTDAPLTFTVSAKFLKMVTRRDAQRLQARRSVEDIKFTFRRSLNLYRNSPRMKTRKDLSSLLVRKRFNH